MANLGIQLIDGRLALANGITTATATGSYSVSQTTGQFLLLDPGGSARDVFLSEAEGATPGLLQVIVNTADAAEDLTVKDDGGSTIGTVSQDELGIFYCDTGGSWNLVATVTTT